MSGPLGLLGVVRAALALSELLLLPRLGVALCSSPACPWPVSLVPPRRPLGSFLACPGRGPGSFGKGLPCCGQARRPPPGVLGELRCVPVLDVLGWTSPWGS